MIVEHPLLQDGSAEPWPADTVASHVLDFVQNFGIQTVRAVLVLLGVKPFGRGLGWISRSVRGYASSTFSILKGCHDGCGAETTTPVFEPACFCCDGVFLLRKQHYILPTTVRLRVAELRRRCVRLRLVRVPT